MENKQMYLDIHQTKINRNIYRPASGLSGFLKTVLSVILLGKSPVSKQAYQHLKKK
jgi:hypothetical protein